MAVFSFVMFRLRLSVFLYLRFFRFFTFVSSVIWFRNLFNLVYVIIGFFIMYLRIDDVLSIG